MSPMKISRIFLPLRHFSAKTTRTTNFQQRSRYSKRWSSSKAFKMVNLTKVKFKFGHIQTLTQNTLLTIIMPEL